jgi:hypothetical protein
VVVIHVEHEGGESAGLVLKEHGPRDLGLYLRERSVFRKAMIKLIRRPSTRGLDLGERQGEALQAQQVLDTLAFSRVRPKREAAVRRHKRALYPRLHH